MQEGSRALWSEALAPLSRTANSVAAWLMPNRNQIADRFPFFGGILGERIT